MKFLTAITVPFRKAELRRAIYLALLVVIALVDARLAPRDRFSFTFDAIDGERPFFEERSLPRRESLEARVKLYIEEALLGPSLVNYRRLFIRGTKLISLILREHVVYANLSAEAALPVEGADSQRRAIELFYNDIRRNFRSLTEIKLFIDGVVPYAYSAKNEK